MSRKNLSVRLGSIFQVTRRLPLNSYTSSPSGVIATSGACLNATVAGEGGRRSLLAHRKAGFLCKSEQTLASIFSRSDIMKIGIIGSGKMGFRSGTALGKTWASRDVELLAEAGKIAGSGGRNRVSRPGGATSGRSSLRGDPAFSSAGLASTTRRYGICGRLK